MKGRSVLISYISFFRRPIKSFQETDKKIKELAALFTTQWGKLIETLVEGDLIKLLKARGIQVERTLERIKGNYKGQNFEYDISSIVNKDDFRPKPC